MSDTPDTDQLICRAGRGDGSAMELLVDKHRDRLRHMIAVRLDPRLVRRVDPSDIVQDVLAKAAARLPEYVEQRPLPFYPWLRQLAWEQLVDVYRRHVEAQKRSVYREESCGMELSSDSVRQLGNFFNPSQTTPSAPVLREELHQRVRAALASLDDHDREILIMRHLEQMKVAEIASILGISEGAVKMRRFRALQRLRELLGPEQERDEP